MCCASRTGFRAAALGPSLDRSNSLFAPTRGFILRVDGEYAASATGSDFAYVPGCSARSPSTTTRSAASSSPPAAARLGPRRRRAGRRPRAAPAEALLRRRPQQRARLRAVPARTEAADRRCGRRAGPARRRLRRRLHRAADQRRHVRCPQLARERPGRLERATRWAAPSCSKATRGALPHLGVRGCAARRSSTSGQVWRERRRVALGGLRLTPGLGIRYFSPVGPIRVDVGYNPGGAERLTVVTTEVCDTRQDPCGDIEPDVSYAPGDLANRRKLRHAAGRALAARTSRSWSRLQFHFSIGQAF
jgi:hypothetical protein